ncbi:hypothetical protein FQN55_000807 [Onygenales sp. PD_40]|nr:hypothetical protein FQN55_000807 [Onygenales sp. PD_40]KAK2774187.1 hypothetical protein FQN53_003726 [Emmonsiellopsis sp. PD_33]KAK2788398.1 hypothetical protein FQN52_006722 [Onygenales sp. PD_12]
MSLGTGDTLDHSPRIYEYRRSRRSHHRHGDNKTHSPRSSYQPPLDKSIVASGAGTSREDVSWNTDPLFDAESGCHRSPLHKEARTNGQPSPSSKIFDDFSHPPSRATMPTSEHHRHRSRRHKEGEEHRHHHRRRHREDSEKQPERSNRERRRSRSEGGDLKRHSRSDRSSIISAITGSNVTRTTSYKTVDRKESTKADAPKRTYTRRVHISGKHEEKLTQPAYIREGSQGTSKVNAASSSAASTKRDKPPRKEQKGSPSSSHMNSTQTEDMKKDRPVQQTSSSKSARRSSLLQGLFSTPTAPPPTPAPKKMVTCLTCLSDDIPSNKAANLACSHHMCHDCLKRIFNMSLTDPQHMPPKCCTADPIPLRHVDKLFNDEFKVKWNRKYQEYTTKNRIYCPAKGCGEWIKPSHIHTDTSTGATGGRKYGKCSRCKTKVCVLCNGKWHTRRDCPKDEDTKRFVETAKEQGWQRCFNCSAMVELKEGCNHMTCRCTAEFCMICGSKWKTCTCPWFNYAAVEADRLAHMNVQQARGAFADANGAWRAQLRQQHEAERRRQQERRDARIARELQELFGRGPEPDDHRPAPLPPAPDPPPLPRPIHGVGPGIHGGRILNFNGRQFFIEEHFVAPFEETTMNDPRFAAGAHTPPPPENHNPRRMRVPRPPPQIPINIQFPPVFGQMPFRPA